MNYPLIIALVVLVSFFRVIFWGSFIIDDEESVKYWNTITPKNKWHKLWMQLRGRNFSNSQVCYSIGILTHLINCLLIYFAFGRNQVSFLTALLFAVHPAGTQGSIWLSGRGYARAAGLVLLMWWLCPLFYLLTPWCAFSAMFAPLLFIKTQWWWIILIPISMRLGKGQRGLIAHRLSVATNKGQQVDWKKVVVALKTLGYYTCFALFPARIGIYHTFLYLYSLGEEDNKQCEKIDAYFWVGVAVLTALLWGAKSYFWHFQALGIAQIGQTAHNAYFGLFWFVLLLMQWCNLITLNQSIASRYVYLPLIGLCYCLANLVMLIPDTTLRFGVCCALFAGYWVRLQLIIPMYYSIYNCIDYGRLNFPNCFVYFTWLGQIEKRRGSFFTALEAWMRGWKMRPTDFRLNNNIAVMLTDLGFLNDSEAFLKQAEDSLIPEQRKAAQSFLISERARIAKAREILKNKAIAERIVDARGNKFHK